MSHLRLTSPTPAPGRRHRTGRHPGGGPSTSPLTHMIYMWHTLWGTCLSLSLSPPASLGSLLCAVTAIRQQCFGRPPVCLRVATVVSGGTSGDWRSGSRRFAGEGQACSLPACLSMGQRVLPHSPRPPRRRSCKGGAQGHEHLPGPPAVLPDVVLDDGVPAAKAVLVPQPLEDALRGVALLLGDPVSSSRMRPMTPV